MGLARLPTVHGRKVKMPFMDACACLQVTSGQRQEVMGARKLQRRNQSGGRYCPLKPLRHETQTPWASQGS